MAANSRREIKSNFGDCWNGPQFDSIVKFSYQKYTKCFQFFCRLDDIQDDSILRRGVPTAHKIFGVASTINAAIFVHFLALQKIIELNHPEAVKVFCEQILELYRGQGMEIYWRDNFECPNEAEYKFMVLRKTGGLFLLALRLMLLFSDNKKDFTRLTSLFSELKLF